MRRRSAFLAVLLCGLYCCPLTTGALLTLHNLSDDQEIVLVRVQGQFDIGFGENLLEVGR